MGGTVRIQSGEELEAWLKDKPVEWARAIAVRSALRVLPFVGRAFSGVESDPRDVRLALMTIRATFISWVAASFPSHDLIDAADDAGAVNKTTNAVAPLAYIANAFVGVRAARGFHVVAAATAAVYAATNPKIAVANAVVAATNAAAAASINAKAMWGALSSDVEALEREERGKVVPFAGRPVWPDGVPGFARREWAALNRHAFVADLGFEPWLMWVNSASEGKSPGEIFGDEITLRIADELNAWWERPVREVNADVAQWLNGVRQEATPKVVESEFAFVRSLLDDSEKSGATDESLPKLQRPAAYTFAWQDARIEARPIALVTEDPQTAADFLSEARRLAGELMERLASTNASPSLKRNLDLLIRSFPDVPTDLRVGIVSSRVRTLGEFINPEIEAELPADAAAMLRGAVGVARDLLACYPQTREIEAERLSLKLLDSDVDAARAGLVEFAERAESVPEVVAKSAWEALRTLADMANEVELSIADVAKRTAEGLLVVRNFVAATVDGSLSEVRSEAGELAFKAWDQMRPFARHGGMIVTKAKELVAENPELVAKACVLVGAWTVVSVIANVNIGNAMLAVFQVTGFPNLIEKLKDKGVPIEETSEKDGEKEISGPSLNGYPTDLGVLIDNSSKDSGKVVVRYFVSYAHDDDPLASDLVKRLHTRLRTSTKFEFERWDDKMIAPGARWREEIRKAIQSCPVGLLLVSPAFLTSDFILKEELGKYVSPDPDTIGPDRHAVPVALEEILFDGSMDLKGLEEVQVFTHKGKDYLHHDDTGRKDFVTELFKRIVQSASERSSIASS